MRWVPIFLLAAGLAVAGAATPPETGFYGVLQASLANAAAGREIGLNVAVVPVFSTPRAGPVDGGDVGV